MDYIVDTEGTYWAFVGDRTQLYRAVPELRPQGYVGEHRPPAQDRFWLLLLLSLLPLGGVSYGTTVLLMALFR